MALTWIENSEVKVFTSFHELGPDHVVARKRKRVILTSTNGQRVGAGFGNGRRKELEIPKVVDDYILTWVR